MIERTRAFSASLAQGWVILGLTMCFLALAILELHFGIYFGTRRYLGLCAKRSGDFFYVIEGVVDGAVEEMGIQC